LRVRRHNLEFGILTTQGSGVVNIQGLLLSFVGQVFEIKDAQSPTCGTIVNLTRDDTMNLIVSGLQLQPEVRVFQGGKVVGKPNLASVILGDFLIGAMLDPLGTMKLNLSKAKARNQWVIEAPAIGIVDRQSVFEPLQTGILALDSMIPIGRGQRELILGDRYTGKSSIGIDTILNQKFEKVLCVYASIGQKASAILEVFLTLLKRDAIRYLLQVVASGSSSSASQFLSAYTGTAVSEFFMLLRQCPCKILQDDLSKHAVAYREIYLLLRRPPGREAYPGEIFFVHSRLLERSALVSPNLGGGSITAFPVIETLGGDVSAYITTNVISITDGQIFLSVDLFLSGIQPSVDVGLSVTRVGSAAQWEGMKLVGAAYKLELAQYMELQAFSQFASDLGQDTKDRLARGVRMVELLKQPNGSPVPLGNQISILSIANQDLISKLPKEKISPIKEALNSLPSWVSLYIPNRLLGYSLSACSLT
jgi:F-type H+-transporting ATPase subunit alpha